MTGTIDETQAEQKIARGAVKQAFRSAGRQRDQPADGRVFLEKRGSNRQPLIVLL
jgi:hypothetical protein